MALARRFRAALGLPPGGASGESAIASVAVPDGTAELLRAGGAIASVRAGRLRCALHLTTTEADVDEAAGLPAGLVPPAARGPPSSYKVRTRRGGGASPGGAGGRGGLRSSA